MTTEPLQTAARVSSRARRHRVDLAGLMALCEINYARLMQLLPDFDHLDLREFDIALPAGQRSRLQIHITERCKYTTMLELKQLESPLSAQIDWAPAPQFSLRAYHDARMVEVIGSQRQRPRRASYAYPNDAMFQRDEKTQLNLLLGEWLSHCLSHGHSVELPTALGG